MSAHDRLGPPDPATGRAMIARLTADLRRKIAAEPAGSDHRDTLQGQLDGLEAAAPLPGEPIGGSAGTPRYRAGYAAGGLYAHILCAREPTLGPWLIVVAVYASELTVRPGQGALDEAPPIGLLKAHAAAAHFASRGGELSADLELELFRWLCHRQSVTLDSDLLARYEAWRERRLARTAGGGVVG